jgi:hypothetical protein
MLKSINCFTHTNDTMAHGKARCVSVAAVLLKRISYDHIWLTRMDAIMFDNDASVCYDRNIPSLAEMMSRCAGMTWNGSPHVLIRLLLNMEYHVRTAYYGVASIAFSNMNKLLVGILMRKVPDTTREHCGH